MKIILSRPAHLIFVTALMLSKNTSAQVLNCSFSYSEKIISAYSSIVSAGSPAQTRRDSIFHSGKMQLTYLADTSVYAQLNTEVFTSSFGLVEFPSTINILLFLDKNYRIKEISIEDSNKKFLAGLRMWLGELNLRIPPGGKVIEEKSEGAFNTNYSLQSVGPGVSSVSKTTPLFIRRQNNRQAILVDEYSWSGQFENNTLRSIQFHEKKRQMLGRRALACIARKFDLKVTGIKKKDGSIGTYHNSEAIPFYHIQTEEERKLRLASSLLGQESFESLNELIKNADSLSGEQQFRLKSMVRSLVIKDTTSAIPLLKSQSTFKPGSSAFDIIENAMIESRTDEGNDYIIRELKKYGNDYERLKELLIKTSVANAFSQQSISILAQLMEGHSNDDFQSIISLALSNYAITIRETDSLFYQKINHWLFDPHSDHITDTLQYLYLVGNAGKEDEASRLIQIARADTSYIRDIAFAFRNIHNSVADSLVENFLLTSADASNEISSLFMNRRMRPHFATKLEELIIASDLVGDSSKIYLLQYLLDNAFEPSIDVSNLMKHEFNIGAYRKEIEEYKKESGLCGPVN